MGTCSGGCKRERKDCVCQHKQQKTNRPHVTMQKKGPPPAFFPECPLDSFPALRGESHAFLRSALEGELCWEGARGKVGGRKEQQKAPPSKGKEKEQIKMRERAREERREIESVCEREREITWVILVGVRGEPDGGGEVDDADWRSGLRGEDIS